MPFVHDTKQCFDVIRNHDFFSKFDFNTLKNMPVPIPEVIKHQMNKQPTMKKKKKKF